MSVYLDTSVLLRRLLDEPGGLREWGRWDEAYTSEITRVEALRSLDRLRLQGKLEDVEVAKARGLLRRVFETMILIALNSDVLEKASQSFPVVVGTLDAIHLASAVLYREEKKEGLIFLTHDHRLGIAAQALGLEARGFPLS